MDWIKYHSQLLTTNNIYCIQLLCCVLPDHHLLRLLIFIYVLMSSGLPWKYSYSVLSKVISGLCTIMPKDNSNRLQQYTIAQGQLLWWAQQCASNSVWTLQQNSSRTTPLMSSKITLMPKTILWTYIQFTKDNSMDFWKTWHNWQWYAALKSLRQAKSFVILFPMWG